MNACTNQVDNLLMFTPVLAMAKGHTAKPRCYTNKSNVVFYLKTATPLEAKWALNKEHVRLL